MSTSAIVKVEGSPTVRFTVSHDGYPDAMVPYLEELVERAREKETGETFHTKLMNVLHAEADDDSIMLERTNTLSQGEYEYCIMKDGSVVVEDEE